MFIEDLELLDCTIRDGGLINKHDFSHEFVGKVYKAVSDAGVDYMEIGYKNSRALFPEKDFGPWKFCDDEDIRKAIELSGAECGAKIAVMADVGRVDMNNVKPAEESPVDMIRTAVYVKDIDKAIDMSKQFDKLGYETAINIMAISRDRGSDLDEALKQVEKESPCKVLNIVDSFGNLFQDTMQELTERFRKHAPSKIIGFHGHNNQQLAFSNSIEGIIHGARSIDATIYGIGRAAGNCTLELMLGFLKNPKYDIRPVLDLIQSDFLEMRKQMEWGYILPYAIAGMLNEHPRDAIALRESDEKDEFRKFYDSCLGPEVE